DTRLRAQPSATGTAVSVEGPRLAGSLSIPTADGAAISGRFARVWWNAPAPAGEGEKQPPSARAKPADRGDDVDPARVPPLDIAIDQLRFGEALLGKVDLRARPVAGGLRIERLQARSPVHAIDVGGDWLGRGAAARTRVEVDVRSEDFGALLAGLGYGGRMSGGDGEAHLKAAWPGSPAA